MGAHFGRGAAGQRGPSARSLPGQGWSWPGRFKAHFGPFQAARQDWYPVRYPGVKSRRLFLAKYLILLVPVERIELPTFGLQNRCSTAELNRLIQQNQLVTTSAYGFVAFLSPLRQRCPRSRAVEYQSCAGRATPAIPDDPHFSGSEVRALVRPPSSGRVQAFASLLAVIARKWGAFS